jgi:hypothetical protein
MICPVHGCTYDGDSPLCEIHDEFLVPYEPEPEPAPPPEPRTEPVGQRGRSGTCAKPGCDTPLLDDGRCPVHMIDTLVTEVGAQRVAEGLAGAGTRHDRTDTPGPVELQFPFGPAAVGDEPLPIGRSAEFSPLGAQLGRYDNVSRTHAVVWRDGVQVYIRDVDSTNGTFVNERKLPPETDHPLRIGDVVGFGADLRAVVQTPSDRPAGP